MRVGAYEHERSHSSSLPFFGKEVKMGPKQANKGKGHHFTSRDKGIQKRYTGIKIF